MIAQARFKSVHCMLLAVFALAPTAVLAQQDNAEQGRTQVVVSTRLSDPNDVTNQVRPNTPANEDQISPGERKGQVGPIEQKAKATDAVPADQREMRGLDEQVQAVKSDVLSIAAELNQLEEKLLYPSGTQVAIFVAMAKDDQMRLDAVRLQVDGQLVAEYIYSFKELEALRKGGVQRIYVGNVATGDHKLDVAVDGKLAGGEDFSRTEHFTFRKEVKPKLVELTMAGPDSGNAPITLGEW